MWPRRKPTTGRTGQTKWDRLIGFKTGPNPHAGRNAPSKRRHALARTPSFATPDTHPRLSELPDRHPDRLSAALTRLRQRHPVLNPSQL